MSNSIKRAGPLLAFVALALAGAAVGIYLTLVHVDYLMGHGELVGACHALAEAGCSITASGYGDIRGIPVATIGFAGCCAMVGIGLVAFRRRQRWEDPARSVMLVLAGCAVLASIVMAGISAKENSFCPFCVGWYGLNAGLLGTAWWARNRDRTIGDVFDDMTGSVGLIAIAIFATTLVTGIAIHNWRHGSVKTKQERMLEDNAEEIAAKLVDDLMATPPKQFDLTGAASKGPSDAEVTLVEFGDFECPHCRKLWTTVEEYAANAKRPVRVVFANFPLDDTCNPHSGPLHRHACKAAVASECARAQGKFWEYADLLFQHQDALGPQNLDDYAKQVGLDLGQFETCKSSNEAAAKIQADIALAQEIEVEATPTFLINGYKRTGGVPLQLLGPMVDEVLRRQSQ